jgi:nucleoid-associated protein YgaU
MQRQNSDPVTTSPRPRLSRQSSAPEPRGPERWRADAALLSPRDDEEKDDTMLDSVRAKLSLALDRVHAAPASSPLVASLAARAGQTPQMVALGGGALLLAVTHALCGADFIAALAGTTLPAIKTLSAAGSGELRRDARVLHQWMTFWFFSGCFIALESACLSTLLYLFPRYWSLKLAALLWLGVLNDGAATVWERWGLREAVGRWRAAGLFALLPEEEEKEEVGVEEVEVETATAAAGAAADKQTEGKGASGAVGAGDGGGGASK